MNDTKTKKLLTNQFIKEIALKNILLYPDTKIRLNPGITLITGPNGSGKSLLLDVIRMGLGLSARSVRMNSIGDYRQDKTSDATIILSLSNPLLAGSEYFLRTTNKEFNQTFLSQNEVLLKRTITKRGDSYFSVVLPNGDWVQLTSDQRQLLEEALDRVGITPKDPITFITGDDYRGFIDKSGHQRYEIMMAKLGLREAEYEYQQTMQQLTANQAKHTTLEDTITTAEKEADVLRYRAEKYQMLEAKEQELQQLAKELAWTPVKTAEERINTIENKITDLNKQLEQIVAEKGSSTKELEHSQQEYKKAGTLFFKQQELTKETRDKYKSIEVNIQRDQQNIDAIKKNKTLFQQGLHKKKLRVDEIEREIKKLTTIQDTTGNKRSTNEQLVKDYKSELAELLAKEQALDRQEKELQKDSQNQIITLNKERETAIQDRIKSQNEMYTLQQPKLLGTTGRKPFRNWDRVIAFKKMLKQLNVADKVVGPLYSVVQPQKGEERWQKALTLAFKGELLDFITNDKEVFNLIVEQRKKQALTDIRIAYVTGTEKVDHIPKNQGPLFAEHVTPEEKDAGLYKNSLNAITGDPLALSYLRNWNNKTILCERKTPVPVTIYQNRGGRFITPELEMFEARKYSTRTGKGFENILDGVPLIGSEVVDAMAENDTVKILKKQLEERIVSLDEAIAEIGNTIATIEGQRDTHITQMRETFKEIINRKKTLNDLIENLELATVNKDNQILIKQLQVELNSLKQQTSTETSDLQTFDNEIRLYEQTITTRRAELTKQNELVKQVQLEEKNLAKVCQDLTTQTEKSTMHIAVLEKKVGETQKDIQKNMHELEIQKKELETFSQNAQKSFPHRPETIRIQTLLKEREQILVKEKTQLLKDGASKEDLDHYETHKKAVNDLKKRLHEAKEEYAQLKSSLEYWHTKWDRIFNTRIAKAQQMYQDILGSINTGGRIEIIDPLNLDYGQASFYVQFPFEEERELQEHSTGQKQIALVALVLALQALSPAPITAIDEFDRGLDIFSKDALMEVVPTLIDQAATFMAQEHDISKYGNLDNQILFICPEIDTTVLPDQINFLTITRKPLEILT